MSVIMKNPSSRENS